MMEFQSSPFSKSEAIAVPAIRRWDIYHRLQQLGIDCSCNTGQPLTAKILTPLDAIQLWSVARQAIAPRQEQLTWLETCWRHRSSAT